MQVAMLDDPEGPWSGTGYWYVDPTGVFISYGQLCEAPTEPATPQWGIHFTADSQSLKLMYHRRGVTLTFQKEGG